MFSENHEIRVFKTHDISFSRDEIGVFSIDIIHSSYCQVVVIKKEVVYVFKKGNQSKFRC